MAEQQSRNQKHIRTDVGVGVRFSTSAVVGEVRVLVVADWLAMTLDDALVGRRVGTEPGSVSRRATREALKVRISVASTGLGAGGGGIELRLSGRRAANERGPLVMDTSDSKVVREPNLSNILNSGEEILGGPISIDIDEEARWLNGVVSSASSSEVVRSRD